jgi:hypothetical protein
MYARGNGATEKGSPDMHSIFKINEIKSPPILIRHLLPFSCIRGEVVDTGVDGSSEKPKRSDTPKAITMKNLQVPVHHHISPIYNATFCSSK